MEESNRCCHSAVTHLTVGRQQVSSLDHEQRKKQKQKEINIMAKFMCTHTIPPGKFSADQLRQFAQAAQQDPTVKDRKSTRLNSSHLVISYAVFCLKKKKITIYLPVTFTLNSSNGLCPLD